MCDGGFLMGNDRSFLYSSISSVFIMHIYYSTVAREELSTGQAYSGSKQVV